MITTTEILNIIGRANLARRLGVGVKTISHASVQNQFPSAWFPVVREMSNCEGIEVPESLFNFKEQADTPAQQAAL